MLLSQKFDSINEIDPEFIDPLEDLLADSVPSFEFIKSYEKNADENINFAYYLFFGNTTNAPIGYAQLEIQKQFIMEDDFDHVEKSSLFSRLFGSKKINSMKVNWKIPGTLDEGFVISPQFSKTGLSKTKSILNEFFKRDDIQEQSICFAENFEELSDKYNKSEGELSSHHSVDFLLKNHENYECYINDLDPELQKQIKNSWKFVYKDLKLSLGEYESFKEIFAYKDQGAKQYKEFKRDTLLAKYINTDQEVYFITLEDKESVKIIIPVIKGHKSNLFYDIFSIADHIPEIIPHQMAILKFYEYEHSNKLRCLGDKDNSHLFNSLGFQSKLQYLFTLKK